jgi:hypothetical protein
VQRSIGFTRRNTRSAPAGLIVRLNSCPVGCTYAIHGVALRATAAAVRTLDLFRMLTLAEFKPSFRPIHDIWRTTRLKLAVDRLAVESGDVLPVELFLAGC